MKGWASSLVSPPDGDDDVIGADLDGFYGSGVESMWWWDQLAPGAAPIGASTDIASPITAYRDRPRVVTRSPEGSGGTAGNALDFLDPSMNLAGDGPPGYDTGDIGRGVAIAFSGTTERPGFRSVGELLGVNEPSFVQSMTQLFDAGVEITIPGVASTLYDDGTGTLSEGDGLVTDPGSGAPIPDYDQQLPIINSVLNTVSVGSDYYAVWFLLHGYSEEDTLNTDVPLTPTVARRFLMIVDRSKVLDRGDAPDILLFREVPVAPSRGASRASSAAACWCSCLLRACSRFHGHSLRSMVFPATTTVAPGRAESRPCGGRRMSASSGLSTLSSSRTPLLRSPVMSMSSQQ